MVGLNIPGLRRVLCLGAHSDDIEIGCGGTLLQAIRANPAMEVVWVVFSAEGRRANEAQASANFFLKRARRKEIVIRNFKGSVFPYQGEAIKNTFEELKRAFSPDLVLTHYRDDRHQDHRVISDLTWNSFRHHLILEYEIPKYDGDLGQPNVFVPLSKADCIKKAAAIRKFFETQRNKHWFCEEIFLGLMRLRGMECAALTKYAEAFYARKILMDGPGKRR